MPRLEQSHGYEVLGPSGLYLVGCRPAAREIFEHYTPRDIVRLTTSLVFAGDDDELTKPGVVRSIYDPTAKTGGFLSGGMEFSHELNQQARLVSFGQELNPESYAICKGDVLVKEQDVRDALLSASAASVRPSTATKYSVAEDAPDTRRTPNSVEFRVIVFIDMTTASLFNRQNAKHVT